MCPLKETGESVHGIYVISYKFIWIYNYLKINELFKKKNKTKFDSLLWWSTCYLVVTLGVEGPAGLHPQRSRSPRQPWALGTHGSTRAQNSRRRTEKWQECEDLPSASGYQIGGEHFAGSLWQMFLQLLGKETDDKMFRKWIVDYPVMAIYCLTMGTHSKKCIARWFHHCVNIIDFTYTNLDGIAYDTPGRWF